MKYLTAETQSHGDLVLISLRLGDSAVKLNYG